METSKRPALIALAKVLAATATPYAIIGGISLQVHRSKPRTAIDVELAIPRLDAIPRAELQAAGFSLHGRFPHSENWIGPEGVPVQFTDDPALAPAVERALETQLDGATLRVLRRSDLLHEKLRSGSDPARRRSKRLQDLVDAQGLLEENPELQTQLSDAERVVLDSLPE